MNVILYIAFTLNCLICCFYGNQIVYHIYRKPLSKKYISYILGFQIIYSFILFPLLRESNDAWYTLFWFISICFSLFFYKDSILRKLLKSITVVACQVVAESILAIFLFAMQSFFELNITNLTDLYYAKNPLFLLFIVLGIISYLVWTYIFGKIFKKIHIEILLDYAWGPAALIGIVGSQQSVQNELYKYNSWIGFVVYALLFVLCIFLYHRWIKILDKRREERITAIQKQEYLSRQLETISNLQEEYKNIRKNNHDLNNHINLVTVMLENGQYEEATSYIHQLLESEVA